MPSGGSHHVHQKLNGLDAGLVYGHINICPAEKKIRYGFSVCKRITTEISPSSKYAQGGSMHVVQAATGLLMIMPTNKLKECGRPKKRKEEKGATVSAQPLHHIHKHHVTSCVLFFLSTFKYYSHNKLLQWQ